LHLDSGKIVAIPVGVKKSQLNHQKIKKELNIEKKLVIGMIGWWEEDNGFDRVVKIWPIISKENPDALLVIAGEIRSQKDALYRKKLLKTILESEDVIGQETIKVLRKYFDRDEYNKLFASFDILILPYQKASKSINLYNAYGHGIPVVAFDIPALKDSLKQSKAGLIVPLNDENKLREAISKLLKNQKLRQKMSERAKDYANRISLPNIAVRHIQLYQSIV
jgi:glycosyltransferase involved in cell wall biosynthesis